MQTILIHSLSGNNNQMFDPNTRDGYNDPAIYLRERLAELGYDLKTADDNSLENCAWVWFYESSSVKPYSGLRGLARKAQHLIQKKKPIRDVYGECVRAGMQDRIAFFPWEAPAVSRENWDPELHKLFPVIFTWHDDYADGKKYFKIHWPQTRQFPEVPDVPFGERKLLVNISMNKVSYHKRELYSARRVSIRYFEKKQPENFDLYGVGWDRPANILERISPFPRQPYSSYRGMVKNKWDVLPRYRFSLCYENIYDEPGWVTEKIFDCMRAKCVPIYWGTSNIADYVDPAAFIDRRKFASDAELETYLLSVGEKEYALYQDAMKEYLRGEKFAKFLPDAYAKVIIDALRLDNKTA